MRMRHATIVCSWSQRLGWVGHALGGDGGSGPHLLRPEGAAFERGTFDVAGARALAGAYGATHINAATNRAIIAVLAHRAGYYNDNKSAFEDYKISSRTYYKWKAAIDNNQPFNL